MFNFWLKHKRFPFSTVIFKQSVKESLTRIDLNHLTLILSIHICLGLIFIPLFLNSIPITICSINPIEVLPNVDADSIKANRFLLEGLKKTRSELQMEYFRYRSYINLKELTPEQINSLWVIGQKSPNYIVASYIAEGMVVSDQAACVKKSNFFGVIDRQIDKGFITLKPVLSPLQEAIVLGKKTQHLDSYSYPITEEIKQKNQKNFTKALGSIFDGVTDKKFEPLPEYMCTMICKSDEHYSVMADYINKNYCQGKMCNDFNNGKTIIFNSQTLGSLYRCLETKGPNDFAYIPTKK